MQGFKGEETSERNMELSWGDGNRGDSQDEGSSSCKSSSSPSLEPSPLLPFLGGREREREKERETKGMSKRVRDGEPTPMLGQSISIELLGVLGSLALPVAGEPVTIFSRSVLSVRMRTTPTHV